MKRKWQNVTKLYFCGPGSPFLLNVGGNPSGRIRETVQKQMEAAEASVPHKSCEFILQIPGDQALAYTLDTGICFSFQ